MLKFNLEINKRLLPIKGLYFLYNAGAFPLYLTLSVYAKQLGFSSYVVGIILTVLPIISMISGPNIGRFTDKYKCRKLTLLILQCLTALAFVAMIFLPGVPVESKGYLDRHDASMYLKVCQENINRHYCTLQRLAEDGTPISCKFKCATDENSLSFISNLQTKNIKQKDDCIFFQINTESDQSNKTETLCDVDCESPEIRSILIKSTMEDDEFYKYYQFWIFLITFLIIWIGISATSSITEVICLQSIGDELHKYGQQLVFSSLGAGIFSAILGVLQDAVSTNDLEKNFMPNFVFGAGIILLSVAVSTTIHYKQLEQSEESTSLLSSIIYIVKNVRSLVYILWVISMGMFLAVIWNYLFWSLEDSSGQSSCETQHYIKTIEGLCITVEFLLGTSVFFFISTHIIKKIGYAHTTSAALLAMSIRLGLYYIIENPWWALPISLLSGPTYGLFYATTSSFSFHTAPTGTEVASQAIYMAAFEGIGQSLGGALAGKLYQTIGGPTTFGLFGIVAFALFLLHVLVQFIIEYKYNKNNSQIKSTK